MIDILNRAAYQPEWNPEWSIYYRETEQSAPEGSVTSFLLYTLDPDRRLFGIIVVSVNENGNAYYDINVTVTNTGAAAGKEVVQVYYTAPYIKGGIEKAHVVLGAFDKTALLQPGQSETLNLTLYEQDMASYDYSDANQNGHTGYELDGGEYAI